MTIDKQPDVIGVMKFRRLVDGKVVEQIEAKRVEIDKLKQPSRNQTVLYLRTRKQPLHSRRRNVDSIERVD